MKCLTRLIAGSALLLAVTPLAQATVFFSDTFGSGSTLNSATPAAPTASSASYQLVSSKSWVPTPTIASGNLKFGIAATSAGHIEAQALFASSPVSLVQVGDYVRLTVVFTNTAGMLTAANTFLGIGLYNSTQVQPVAGGLNGTAVNSQTGNTTGGVQNWQGYWAQISYSGQSSRILTRPAQTSGPDNRNQDLVTTGSGSQSYATPGGANVSANTNALLVLTNGNVYTAVLTINLNDVNSLGITNTLYEGPTTNGTLRVMLGGVATNTTLLHRRF
ncbi:MAG: hypothetical protein QM813_14425 [Verrucomicrobiota bacterium]